MDKCLELLILIMLGFRRNYRSTKFFVGPTMRDWQFDDKMGANVQKKCSLGLLLPFFLDRRSFLIAAWDLGFPRYRVQGRDEHLQR